MLPPFDAAHACVAPPNLHLTIGSVVCYQRDGNLGEVVEIIDEIDGLVVVSWEYGEIREEDAATLRVVGLLEALMLGFVFRFG